MQKKQVLIIGAGLTGLIAAKSLDPSKYKITVIDKSHTPGGRIASENIDGWQIDKGFQVLLTDYPYLRKHLDFEALQLVKLSPSTVIFKQNKKIFVGDPTRTKGALFKTLFSAVGSLKDKYLVFKLKLSLDKLSIDQIFEQQAINTLTYLKDYGFSDEIISNFFKPFFGGIFLEKQLSTPHNMFLFIFKMFSSGYAAIPKNGMGEVGKQLVETIGSQNVNFIYDEEVIMIDEEKAISNNQNEYPFDYLINTNPTAIQSLDFYGTHNIYFEHDSPKILPELCIGLNANENRLINNIFYASDIKQHPIKKNKVLLSVTVLNLQGQSKEEMVQKVKEELLNDFGIENAKLINHQTIPIALPKLSKVQNEFNLEIFKDKHVFQVGDFLLNGSQNAACKIGEDIANYLNEL